MNATRESVTPPTSHPTQGWPSFVSLVSQLSAQGPLIPCPPALFPQDMHSLGCLPPSLEPKATDFIPQMIATIERIMANGHAYAVQVRAEWGWSLQCRLMGASMRCRWKQGGASLCSSG